MANGYFRVVKDETGFGVEIKAPTEGGERVRAMEVSEYLAQNDITCDVTLLNKEIEKGQDTVFHLGSGDCPVIHMNYRLFVGEDMMEATARLYAPSETGKEMEVQEFLNDLKYRQINYGIKQEGIWKAFDKKEFCTDFVVAKGKAPQQGTDARIEYYFNTDLRARPTLLEDGSVDFFHLNTINACKEGDLLAKLIPADPGSPGRNIQGTVLRQREVKNAKLRYGHNIAISEDRTELTSMVNGHVTLVEDKVFVSDVLQLENVDTSTGNIEYEGSVMISGNVRSNFEVKAGGNIVVSGLVECAKLEAGGDIVIARGMAGMGKGELKAGGNITAKFLENTTASAVGYVATESILHSTVSAEGDVTVDGKKGFIAGGRVCATNLVQVKTLGSPLGTSTVIEVGADPIIKRQYAQKQKEVAELSKTLASIEPVLVTYAQKRRQGVQFTQEQIQYVTNILKLREQKAPELEAATKEMDSLQQLIEQQSNAQIVVKGEVFPGTKIVIGDVSMAVQSNMQYCKFMKVRGDVKMVSI